MATTVGRVGDGSNGVYIGRQSTPMHWGNPFKIGAPHPLTKKPMTREDVIDQYEYWLATSTDERVQWIRDNAHKLKGKHLLCFCAPLPCHGDVLAKLAEAS